MKIKDLFNLSMRSFKTRPMRTALTVLGMGVGIGAILFLVSFGYGLQQGILGQITTADSLLSLDVSPGTSGLIQLDKWSLEKISEIPEVTEVSPVISQPGQLTVGEITGDAAIYAIDESFFRLSGVRASYGDVFSEENKKEIVISSIGAKLFNFEDVKDIVGQEIYLSLFVTKVLEEDLEEVELVYREEPYKIVGVINDENANYVYLPLDSLVDLELSNFDSLKVKVGST
ncbi:ABC transporter permease [Candidatus Parcubacteria bacterium]|jgi:ABC-type antimicrobial peptide transport system permease subunit|nr:ABC transporter permease [Candidatus Parcubacteria bacterium]MBT7228035.1 ABC transporter permease [Candidatus Parcubacteria bacterium]